MTLNTYTDGQVLTAAQLNNDFTNAYPRVVASTPYTSTGFDASRSGSGGTTTNNTTLTVSSGSCVDYVRILVTALINTVQTNLSNYGRVSLKIETSVASAASWTTRFDQVIQGGGYAVNDNTELKSVKTIEFYYAPTAGEKSAGLDIRITGTAFTAGTGGVAEITNVQTMVYAN